MDVNNLRQIFDEGYFALAAESYISKRSYCIMCHLITNFCKENQLCRIFIF